MKNVSNPYGYYLTEDFETIEFRGDFEENVLFLPTKNPDEQLNYKVFVSPKRAINFGIQIVGGDFPQNIYIPQHIYIDLQIAYSENNPYYTINQITIIKLDFTNTGNSLIKYLKNKFETPSGTPMVSKIKNSGVDKITNYAGFKISEQPDDESIIKQILFLFDEQNDIVFIEKNKQLITEDVVNEYNAQSNRITGNFEYISNYFDSTNKFKVGLLNSINNVKLESNAFNSILQLNDFVKANTNKSLTELNSVYTSNSTPITKPSPNRNPLELVGKVIAGIGTGIVLVRGLDKVSQLKAQKVLKEAEATKNLSLNTAASAQSELDKADAALEGGIAGAKGNINSAISNIISIFKKPVIPKISIKNPPIAIVKPKFNKFKIQAIGETFNSTSNPFNIPSVSGLSNPINIGNKFPISNSIKTISTIGNVSLKEGTNMIESAAGQTAETLKAANADFLKL